MKNISLMAAVAGILATENQPMISTRPYITHEPDNRGRNKEKAEHRMIKAEAKRKRKLQKRLACK